jgi:hypothetical protein
MSTITRIKGNIDNVSFPILTEDGLKSYFLGKFENGLSQYGYYLNASQESAIETFVNGCQEIGVVDSISAMFPFVGNSTCKNAAKVPIFGDIMFDFADSFSDLDYLANNNIKGITRTPSTSIKVSDVYKSNCVGTAVSFSKINSTNITYNDKLVEFTIDVHTRFNNRIGIYCRDNAGLNPHVAADDLSNKATSGTIHAMMICEGNKYVFAIEKGGSSESKSGTFSTTTIGLNETDMNLSMTRVDAWDVVETLTSLTFFDKIVTKEVASAYIALVKQLMSALGRE